jgi:uncharacterized protein (DUF3084 family)
MPSIQVARFWLMMAGTPSLPTESSMKLTVIAFTALLAAGSWAATRVTAQAQARDATLRDVVTEIRLLRDAVQSSSRTQVLASMVALQQAKAQSSAAELASLRRDLHATTESLRETERVLAEMQSPIQPREEILRSSLRKIEAMITTLRRQEAELTQRLQAEGAGLAKLVAELQEAAKR